MPSNDIYVIKKIFCSASCSQIAVTAQHAVIKTLVAYALVMTVPTKSSSSSISTRNSEKYWAMFSGNLIWDIATYIWMRDKLNYGLKEISHCLHITSITWSVETVFFTLTWNFLPFDKYTSNSTSFSSTSHVS